MSKSTRLGAKISVECRDKLNQLCQAKDLHQGQMIEELINFYLDRSSSNKSKNKSQVQSTPDNISILDLLDLNAEEIKAAKDAEINYGRDLKTIAQEGLMYRVKYINTNQTNFDEIPKEELRTSNAKGVAAYKIGKCVEAIMHHNDMSPEGKDRVCITATLVQKLSGSNSNAVNRWFKEHRVMIDDHNSKFSLDYGNNRRGAGFDFYELLNLEYLKP